MNEISSFIEQFATAPVGLIIVIGVVVVGYFWKLSALPNRWIPLAGLVVAVAGNCCLGDTGKVSPNVTHPTVQLAFIGLAYWGVAWALHAQILKRIGLGGPTEKEPDAKPETPVNT